MKGRHLLWGMLPVLCLCLPALHTRVYFRVLEPGFLGLRASVAGRSTVRADDPLEQV